MKVWATGAARSHPLAARLPAPLARWRRIRSRASDIASALSAVFDDAGTYTLDQITDAAHHVNAPGKIGTAIVKT